MAKKNRYRTRVESIHEEENHTTGWGTGWDHDGWGKSGFDQNGWHTAPAHDGDVQPGDSISNASFDNTNSDWESAAPTPLTKDTPMAAIANAWGWTGAPSEPSAKSTTRGRHSRHQSMNGSAAGRGMQSMLTEIAEQRRAQRQELTEQLRQHLEHAQGLTYAHRNPGRHQRESSWGGAQWGQTSEVGTSHSHRAAGETNWGDVRGSAWNSKQNVNGSTWAETGEESGMNTKSKKKRSKGGEQQAKGNTKGNNNAGGWGGESSWGSAAGWGSSVTPGGFGATNTNQVGWGANASDEAWEAWGTDKMDTQAPGPTQSNSWGGWADAKQDVGKGKPTKSGLSGFFSRVFGRRNKSKKEKGKQKEIEKDVWAQETKEKETKGNEKKKKRKEEGKEKQEQGKRGKTLKKQKFAEPEATTWPIPEDEDEVDDDDETGWQDVAGYKSGSLANGAADGWDDATPGQVSKPSDGWGNSSHAKASKTYTIATEGRAPDARLPQSDGQGIDHRIVESKGEALVLARVALFSGERLARDRIFWFFDPNNDVRVSSMLKWIMYMQVPLATFGFSKFMESRERGGLFANVEYRAPSAPHEPAFDWLTFDKIQPTMDRILQEQIAFYDPSSHILVFVLLLSRSKRSMAIWRHKLPLPDSIRHTYGAQIAKLVASLSKKYPIRVDELSIIDVNLNIGILTFHRMPASTHINSIQSTSNLKRWLGWGRT